MLGTSITLLEKDRLQLSIEIDDEIKLEISTGFHVRSESHVSVGIPVSIEDLTSVIDELTRLRDKFKASWKCSECGMINAEEQKQCQSCEFNKTIGVLP